MILELMVHHLYEVCFSDIALAPGNIVLLVLEVLAHFAACSIDEHQRSPNLLQLLDASINSVRFDRPMCDKLPSVELLGRPLHNRFVHTVLRREKRAGDRTLLHCSIEQCISEILTILTLNRRRKLLVIAC